MKDPKKFRIIVELVQWALIIGLLTAYLCVFFKFKNYTNESHNMEKYNTIHRDRKIDELIQRNQMLEDSIKVLNNAEISKEL